MNTKIIVVNCLAFSLTVALSGNAVARSIRLFGPPARGYARPPILLNTGPFDVNGNLGPYSVTQIREAYGVDLVLAAGATGSRQIIGIVDAYGDNSIQSDLNNFCSYYGIPSTTVQVDYPGGKPRGGSSGWALETALDVEWAHAIAPDATIQLEVAKSSSDADLLAAVDAAVAHGAKVVSMSWGGQEDSSVTAYDKHFQASGVTFVASSGDSGELTNTTPDVEWPASSQYVVGVGGTSLALTTNSDGTYTYASENAWSSSGGGLSSVYLRPSWQNTWNTYGSRGVPDVAYVGDPSTGVGVVYGPFLYEVGGTSVGAPQWAALIALANSARTSGTVNGNSDIYAVAGAAPNISTSTFFDIIGGANGAEPDDECAAGYDLVTGLGSPFAPGLVSALAPSNPDFAVSVTPGSNTVAPGGGTTYNVSVASSGGFTGTVNLVATVSSTTAGITVSPSSTLVDFSSTSSSTYTLTVGTLGSTPAGTYSITVSGTATINSATVTRDATADLVVANPPTGVTIDSFSPTSIQVGATVLMSIGGSGFESGATVSFVNGKGPAPTASVTTVSSTSIGGNVTASNHAKSGTVWDVVLTNPDGGTATLAGALTVN